MVRSKSYQNEKRVLTLHYLGHRLGKTIEEQFTEKAKAAGLSEEEAKFAFNQNMMSGGVLSQDPKHFSKEYGHRWLVSAYEAGDVVLHSSYAVMPTAIEMFSIEKLWLTKCFRSMRQL